MLETEFFPTSTPVIRRMVAPLIKTYGTERILPSLFKMILDPQSGSGSILDYLFKNLGVKKSCLHAIKINPDLRYTLQGKTIG